MKRTWTGSYLMGAAVLLALTGCGSATNSDTEPASSVQSNPNAALMVESSLMGLTAALADYSQIKIDPNNPWGNLGEVKAGFEKIETNYTLLKNSVGIIESQSELGQGAPDLGLLRTLVNALGPYVDARNSYYVAIESCGPIEANRQPTDCDTAAYDVWEKPMVDSLEPVSDAFSNLSAALKNSDGGD
jgi:hypothetical protein